MPTRRIVVPSAQDFQRQDLSDVGVICTMLWCSGMRLRLSQHRTPRCKICCAPQPRDPSMKRPEAERADASRRARELVESHPDTRQELRESGRVELFYDTEVYWCRKLSNL